MFFFLDLIHLAYQATRTALGITMGLAQGYTLPADLNAAIHIQAERGNYREVGEECLYDGVLMPFDRSWEEIDSSTGVEIVRKAEPGKIAGYAVVFYKKTCKGTIEPVLRMGSYHHARAGTTISPTLDVDEYDFSKPDMLPKWLDQIKGKFASISLAFPQAGEALYSISSQGTELMPAIVAGRSFSEDVSNDPLVQVIRTSDYMLANEGATWQGMRNPN
jgi:hypothetical protein